MTPAGRILQPGLSQSLFEDSFSLSCILYLLVTSGIPDSYIHRKQFSDTLQTTDEDRNEEKSQIKRKAEDIYADIHVSRPFAFIGGHWNLFSGYAGGVPSHLLPLYFILQMILYLMLYNRPIIINELVSFATQYGQIQKELLRELSVPYSLLDEGWENNLGTIMHSQRSNT